MTKVNFRHEMPATITVFVKSASFVIIRMYVFTHNGKPSIFLFALKSTIHFKMLNSLRAVSLNIGLRATTSLCGKPNNRLVK